VHHLAERLRLILEDEIPQTDYPQELFLLDDVEIIDRLDLFRLLPELPFPAW